MSRWIRLRWWLADVLDALACRVRPTYPPMLSIAEIVGLQRDGNALRALVLGFVSSAPRSGASKPPGAVLREDT